MKKKLYIVIISILAIAIVGTAFIPLTNNLKTEKGKSGVKVVHSDPEAGYIEKIGE